jgi:hypothetical protein
VPGVRINGSLSFRLLEFRAYKQLKPITAQSAHSLRISNDITMSPSTPQLPIIFYHYPYSPYARRIVWYLRLRGFSYMECVSRVPLLDSLTPPLLPRYRYLKVTSLDRLVTYPEGTRGYKRSHRA